MDKEQAEIARLQAEIKVLDLQAQQLEETLAQRHKRKPDQKAVIQSIVAGLVLAGSFFFLFNPVINAYQSVKTEETALATLRAEQGILRAQIQEDKNHILEARNDRDREVLNAEIDKAKNNLALIALEKQSAINLIEQLKKEARILENENIALSKQGKVGERHIKLIKAIIAEPLSEQIK